MKKNYKIRVKGIVQGVGFRPFIYRIAHEFNIKGSVKNDTEGVLIFAEGTQVQIDNFINKIKNTPPPLSSIQSITKIKLNPMEYDTFNINKSNITESRFTFLPPDTTVCDKCLGEFIDGNDRRFHYPFINCTDCGPRFSIINDIPYDRKKTSMDRFVMCSPCQKEYEDHLNRRFHSQPNACQKCGPYLSLFSSNGRLIADKTSTVISSVVDLLLTGKIIAIKGIGGFLLATDATNDMAVKELRRRKARPFKPFALMAGTIKRIRMFLNVSPLEEELLLSKERPIVILKEKKFNLSRGIAPSITSHGIMLPYTPFLHLLFSGNSNMVLIMTSGNIADEPIIYRDDDAFKYLSNIADYIAIYNRDIIAQSDDSVLFVEDKTPYFIRRSRGYVPVPFYSTTTTKQHILATGGDLKNTFALARDNIIILSQHLGDLASPSTNDLYRKMIEHFKKIYDFSPEIVVSDLHPAYFTTLFADELKENGLKKISVQHHHAHIASVIEDNQLDGKVIGLAFDGTGYGVDGTLWGSEFIIADKKEFKRIAHFSDFHLPGGEKAIKDVWKIAISLLYDCYGSSIPLINNDPQVKFIVEIIKKKINSPLTCSIGRIFDGISSLLGLSETISTEAEAAILLEETALKGNSNNIKPFLIPFNRGDTIILQTKSLTRYIYNLIKNGKSREDIAYIFHQSIASSTINITKIIRDEYGINRIALSGGVFQNRLLLNLIIKGLTSEKFDIYTPLKVPFNDGCISLGQLAISKELLRNE